MRNGSCHHARIRTDRSDARGIADMMRLGHYRPVHVKSRASQLLRTTLIARRKFAEQMVAIEATIRGLLKVHGLKLGNVHRCTFAARVETLLTDAPELRLAIEPLLEARNVMRKQKRSSLTAGWGKSHGKTRYAGD